MDSSNGGSPSGSGPHVQLGDHTYPVYPQRVGYLRNRLAKFADRLQGGVEAGVIEWLASQGYEVVRIFIPKLMPRHEFEGFESQEAMEAGDYDEDKDRSPDFPQIVNAVRVASSVNNLDLFSHLGKLVDAETRSALVAMALTRSMASTGDSSVIESSATTADTPSTPSGTTDPTLTPSAA